MRTIPGGVADRNGKTYSINLCTALVPSGKSDFSRILGNATIVENKDTYKNVSKVDISCKENILKCACCDNIKVNGIWGPNNGFLSAEQLRKECPTVICPDCQPRKQT